MGFSAARQEASRALEEGRIQHEARDEVNEKNLLLTGDVTPAQVVHLLKVGRGTQYTCSPHFLVREIDEHIFKPVARIEPGPK
jgi:hypothetical protein